MKETALVRQILDYCSWQNLLFWRNQSGAVKVTNSYGKQHMMRLGATGSPDLIGCIKGNLIGIECKVGKNKTTQLQEEFGERIRKAGGLYKVVYSLDEFIEFINQIKK